MLAATALIPALELAACKGGSSTPPCEEPPKVQVLVQTSDRANVGDNGQSWPTKLVIYQLSGNSRLDQLDPETLKEQGEQLFKDEFVDKRELTAFPTTAERVELTVKPKVSHLLVVAEFRETLGTAWYATYTVPSGLRDNQCAAVAKEEEPALPCMYLTIEGSEMAGGGFAPAGFSLAEFETVCASVGPPKKKAKKKSPPKKPDVPDLNKKPPKVPGEDLSAPQAPRAPNKPTAPRVPGR